MSKLPNAPLLEVIFELKWQMTNNSDLVKSQYLHGDLFSILKSDYPERESLTPPDVPPEVFVNRPMYRFRKKKNGYPLFQVGPGLITLNCNDDDYYWEEYYQWAQQLVTSFFSVYDHSDEKFRPSFLYVDFFKIDLDQENILEFIGRYFSLNIQQAFFKPISSNPKSFNLGLTYETELGDVSISIQSGKNKQSESGIILQTRLNGDSVKQGPKEILEWLGNAHDFCSKLFKELTKGELYESFKN